ncbi:hypothetical protein [Acetivibrio cellulolyticus]|uniref:hypothetical protein n=1 Tax=Acetivibrio cellulolyticus TaxID=35830 RepID=UPI0001E2F0DF|nr:hypothetical protein [Acetivibrio cellulolyticus]
MKTKGMGQFSNKMIYVVLAFAMLFAIFIQNALACDEGPLAEYDTQTTGEVRIDFATTGNSTNMRCDFDGAATAVWHWADGTTTTAVSGVAVSKIGLGTGAHLNYLTISNGSALTRFGAANAGYGHLVLVSGLQNCPNMAILYAYQENSLTSIGNTSSAAIREYHLMNTSISAAELDGIFADAVESEVQGGILWADTSGTSASDADKTTLQARGWTLSIPAWTPQTPAPTPTVTSTIPTSTNEVRINFSTTGDSTNMRCDFDGAATAVWHWADGTTTAAVSGASVEKSGLGNGVHQNYLTVSNGSALTRFGAGNTGYGHLVSISGLQNCPNMAILYAYQENNLTSIGDTSTTVIREYHLMNTSITATELDGVFAAAVESEVQGGILWADTSGTSASDADKTTLQARGWTLSIPAWTPQIPAPTPTVTPVPTVFPTAEGTITFITEGSSFAPVIQVTGNAQITWTFADGTTSSSNSPVKDYGSAGTRAANLVVTPWSAVTHINIGYDAGDGGASSIEFVPDQHVSSVYNLSVVAPYLRQWCSSYNQLTSLDFSNFTQLDTIECFLSQSLRSVNLTNTPELKRACFEDCNLLTLDLSQSPKLEDLRGAVNQNPTINFGSVGENIWHICVRDNPQYTNQYLFEDMSQFPNIAELFIWNDNQAGSIRIPSSSKDRDVGFLAAGNHYTSLNLQGALQLSSSVATVDFSYNLLESVDLTGCSQINNLNLRNNQLSSSEADEILAALDNLGRSRDNVPSWAELYVDISQGGNQQPSQAGYASALSLSGKGWTVVATGWTMLPSSTPETGEARIDFTTTGDSTTMRCDFIVPATAVWHWADGTTTDAVSGTSVTKSGLGDGTHQNYLTISNGSALTRFGAGNAGNGHIVSISGLQNCPELNIVYAYLESSLTSIGDTSTSRIDEYHLMGTQLSSAEMDRIFADAVASEVQNGIIYGNNAGTAASDANKATLRARGWTIY